MKFGSQKHPIVLKQFKQLFLPLDVCHCSQTTILTMTTFFFFTETQQVPKVNCAQK